MKTFYWRLTFASQRVKFVMAATGELAAAEGQRRYGEYPILIEQVELID